MGKLRLIRLIAASIVLVVFSQALLLAPAAADLTAANTNHDRGPFIKCGDAMDVMSASNDARIKATGLCLQAMSYYAKKMDAAMQKSKADTCLYGLYAGSSAERAGYVVSFSANQAGSKKLYAQGDAILDVIIANCAGQPNIETAAKAIRRNAHPK